MIKRPLIIALLCILCTSLFAQTGSLKGKVVDSAGTPVEGAVVTIENSKYLAATDSKGNYKINNIPVGVYSILVEIVGYNSVEAKTTIKENQTTEQNFNLQQVINQLKKVDVVRPMISGQGMGRMPDTYDGVIYSGMKTEVLVLDSVDANKAQNNPRETLGRLPGSNYSETEGGGFPSNGIAFRGLIPTQSVEIQTRQNGYNLSGDVYGYPEAYYLPPLVAVSRIEVIRGESSLQFGPQFGGVINYVVKDGPDNKPWEFSTEETGASYGFVSSVIAGGGSFKKWSYYSFIQYKSTEGWRPNSDIRQITGFAKIEYRASEKFKIGLEYTLLRNKLHMPGGLNDVEFEQNPDQSFRTRNWLTSPWNLLALTGEYKISEKSILTLKSVLNSSARNLVWKNEDGGPQRADSISPVTNSYVPREVQRESFVSVTNELRSLTNYNIGKINSTLAVGVRYFQGNMERQGGGPGSTGSDFDLTLYGGDYQYALFFTTGNVAPFIQNTFRIGGLSITPGFRYEYINSTANGYVTDPNTSAVVSTLVSRTWYIPLGGCGLQFKTSEFTNIYGNFSQAYEPTTYENLTPIGSSSFIDPNMKDVNGYNADFGWRGKFRRFLNFDVGVFYMAKNDEIGLESLTDLLGNPYTYRTNIGNSVHKGIETYIELHPFHIFSEHSKIGDLSFFNSYAYDQSRYVSGPFTGNYEEQAPVNIERIGVSYSYKMLSTTVVYSYSSESYGDANNTIFSEDAAVGLIPAYTVVDWSSTCKIKNYALKFGISNLLDAKYFNLRTDEYPGPGIIPAPGRNFYVGLSATF